MGVFFCISVKIPSQCSDQERFWKEELGIGTQFLLEEQLDCVRDWHPTPVDRRSQHTHSWRAQFFIERQERKRKREEDLEFLRRWNIPDLSECDFSDDRMIMPPASAMQGVERDGRKRAATGTLDREEEVSSEDEKFEEGRGIEQIFNMMKKNTKMQSRQITAIQTDVQEIKAVQTAQDVSIKELQAQMKEVREGSASTSAGSGAQSVSGMSAKGFGKGFPRAWAASKIELKGWVIHWKDPPKRTQEMLTAFDAEQLIENTIKTLTPELAARIDRDASLKMMGSYEDSAGRMNTRSLISKISLKVVAGTDSSQMWLIRKAISTSIAQLPNGPLVQNMTSMPDTMTAANVRIVIESPPWQQAHIAKVGQFKEMWKSIDQFQDPNNIAQNLPQIRGKAGPPLTEILTVVPNSQMRPLNLAEWTETRGWVLVEENLKRLAPTIQLDQVRNALQALA